MSFFVRIQLLLLSITILIGGSSAFFAGKLLEKALRQELTERGTFITQTLVEAYTNSIANSNLLHVIEGIRELDNENKDVSYIYFIGFDGQLATHSFEDGFPVNLIDAWDGEPEETILINIIDDQQSKRFMEIRQYLITDLLAEVHVGLNFDNINQQVSIMYTKILQITILITGMAVLFGFLFVYRFTSPLSRLSSLFHRIGKGEKIDLEHIDLNANGKELKELTTAFKNMLHEREKAQINLSYQATHDALTGMINRHEFEHRTERLLSTILADHGGEHAMCFLDLDQFKVINDTCGHAAGDELLRQLSLRLQGVVRKRDTLARLGGDEFGVLLEHCSLKKAQRVAESMLKIIGEYQFAWDGKIFRVSVSIGLVAVTKYTQNITDLMMLADTACYMAKDSGRNRIHVYQQDDLEIARHQGEMQWVTKINQAIEENRFCLYAQPIVSLSNNNQSHFEILIRMKTEDGEIIPPGAFLPAAERYNLMEVLDTWVINTTFNFLIKYPLFIEKIHFISINLSGASLTNEKFLDFILSKLNNPKIDSQKICFEITETVAITNLNSAVQFISILREKGCLFALDDFGSGLSSFGYLKNLPVDYLKIDGMFVKDMIDDRMDHAMVKSINEIGHIMGIKTIAEFVENDQIKGMLKALGVDYVQGYGIGKPEPFDEILNQVISD